MWRAMSRENVEKAKRNGILGINIGKNKDTPNEKAADDYIYGSRFDAAAEGDETKTQNDVQLAVGFGFPVGR